MCRRWQGAPACRCWSGILASCNCRVQFHQGLPLDPRMVGSCTHGCMSAHTAVLRMRAKRQDFLLFEPRLLAVWYCLANEFFSLQKATKLLIVSGLGALMLTGFLIFSCSTLALCFCFASFLAIVPPGLGRHCWYSGRLLVSDIARTAADPQEPTGRCVGPCYGNNFFFLHH